MAGESETSNAIMILGETREGGEEEGARGVYVSDVTF